MREQETRELEQVLRYLHWIQPNTIRSSALHMTTYALHMVVQTLQDVTP